MDIEKQKNLNFIKKFSKITITKVCKNAGVLRQNIVNGKANAEKVKKVREEIESEIAKLYLKNNIYSDTDSVKENKKNGENTNTL